MSSWTELLLSVQPALCCFVDWILIHSEYFFFWKNDFTLLRARFQQILKKTSYLSSLLLLNDSKMLRFFEFQGRKLKISFYNCPHWFWIHLKSKSIFLMTPPYPLSNGFDVAFRTTWAKASAFKTIFVVAELFVPPHRIINCGFWYFYLLYYLWFGRPRAIQSNNEITLSHFNSKLKWIY